MIKQTPKLAVIAMAILSASCTKVATDQQNLNPFAAANNSESIFSNPSNARTRDYIASDFKTGTLGASGASAIVPPDSCKFLGGDLSGGQIAVSNLPEIVHSEGWLMRDPVVPGTTTTRAYLRGNFLLYLYHDYRQKAGAPTAPGSIFVHILAANRGTTAQTMTMRGVWLDKSVANGIPGTSPLQGSGPSYQVADRFWRGNFNATASISIPGTPTPATPLGTNIVQLARYTLPLSQVLDGRFEFSFPNDCDIYTVLTNSGRSDSAINYVKRNKRADGEFTKNGVPIVETGSTYGRECGYYSASGWQGKTNITLPANGAPYYMGLYSNTDNKFVTTRQNFTSPASAIQIMPSGGTAATRSYGCYGHFFNDTIDFRNPTGTARRVQLYMACNQAGSAASSFWFWAPTHVNTGTSNTPGSTNIPNKPVFCTGAAPRYLLGDWNVPAGTVASPGLFRAVVRFYIPGLITAGQQFIVVCP